MKEKKSPSPPSLPPDAQREILNRLSAETRISSQEIAAILKRHGVCGDRRLAGCLSEAAGPAPYVHHSG